MSLNQPIRDLEKAKSIPEGTAYVATMGDGSGTKAVTQETLAEETGKTLKVGNLEELQTKNKENLVAAINEAAQSGGGGAAVDILDTKEEIEANTEAEKVAGALAVKEMIGELNDNLGGCSLEQEGDDFYIVGADAVRKKLQGSDLELITINKTGTSSVAFDQTVESNGKTYYFIGFGNVTIKATKGEGGSTTASASCTLSLNSRTVSTSISGSSTTRTIDAYALYANINPNK